MNEKQRTWISTLIGIIAVMLVIWLSPKPHYQARGILLPSQQVHSPVPVDQVIQLPNRPFNGVLIGHINIERHYPAPGETAQHDIAQLAQQLAADAGANAFVVTLFRLGQVTSNKFIYVFQATAYYSPTIQSAVEFSRR